MLRFFLAVVFLLLLLFFAGSAEVVEVLRGVSFLWLLGFLAFALPMVWSSALKWELFLKAGGNRVPLLHLMKLYLLSYFFNSFLPSVLGGDLARSFHLGRHMKNQRDAFVATFLERFTGMLAMCILGTVFYFLGSNVTRGLGLAIMLVSAVTVMAGLCIFSEKLATITFSLASAVSQRLVPRKHRGKVSSLLDKVNQGMAYSRKNPALLVKAMLLSFLFHFFTVVNTYLAARAIGWENPDIAGLFVVVPLVLLVSIAPITPSGIGIQEGAFLFLLQRIGATPAQGLSLGLLIRFKALLLAALGGLVWLQVRQVKNNGEENVEKALA